MRFLVLLILLFGCTERGEVNLEVTERMQMELVKGVRFIRLPQLINTCIGYAWMGASEGGPLVFTVPCESFGDIQPPCVPLQPEKATTETK